MDVLKHFRVDKDADFLRSGRVWGTCFLVCKCAAGMSIVEQWRQCYYDHFDFADDTPSCLPNLPGFVENSHDQSILSPLCKLNGAYLLSCAEFVRIRAFMPEDGNPDWWPEYWWQFKNQPVLAKRDLGRYTKFVECPDLLKPLLGKRGRKLASRLYDALKAH